MMSGTKVFNKSAKRNFHQRESHDDEIATIYYYSGKEKKPDEGQQHNSKWMPSLGNLFWWYWNKEKKAQEM